MRIPTSGQTPSRSLHRINQIGTAMQNAMAMRQSQRRSSQRSITSPMWPQGFGQRAFDRPAMSSQAEPQRLHREVLLARPFCNRLFAAIEQDSHVSSRVIGLLSRTGPAAITWRIVRVIVEAVQRVPDRARSHVRQEAREVLAPFITHTDATPAVARIFRTVRIRTAIQRAFPTPMFTRAAATMRAGHDAHFIANMRVA